MDISSKLKQLSVNEVGEDKLRKEIIDQGRKMNELRAEHERSIYELTSENNHKIDQLQNKFD